MRAAATVPMACAKLLRPVADVHESRFQRRSREWFDKLIESYGRLLSWVLDRQTLTLWVAVATLFLTVALYVLIPKGFFPVQDTGLIQGISEAPQSISYAAMAERQGELAKVVLKDPDVESLSSFIGVDGTNTTLNSGRLLINLKPHDQRSADVSQIIRRLSAAAESVPGISLYMQPCKISRSTIPSARPSTNSCCRTPIRRAHRMDAEARGQASRAAAARRRCERSRSARARRLCRHRPRHRRTLRHYASHDRQCTVRCLRPAHRVDDLHNTNQYRVILEADPVLQTSLQALNSIYLQSATGSGQVPLSVVARVREQVAPLQIDHLGQFPAAIISFNLAPGSSLGEAITAIKTRRERSDCPAA